MAAEALKRGSGECTIVSTNHSGRAAEPANDNPFFYDGAAWADGGGMIVFCMTFPPRHRGEEVIPKST